MTTWRMKLMPLSEWAQFQQLFGEFQLLYCHGDRDLALFIRQKPGATLDEVYITGPKLEIIERFSPGGWEDADPPAGEGLLLLAGTAESWTHLSLSTRPSS
jgi:hypothetical protein